MLWARSNSISNSLGDGCIRSPEAIKGHVRPRNDETVGRGSSTLRTGPIGRRTADKDAQFVEGQAPATPVVPEAMTEGVGIEVHDDHPEIAKKPHSCRSYGRNPARRCERIDVP